MRWRLRMPGRATGGRRWWWMGMAAAAASVLLAILWVGTRWFLVQIPAGPKTTIVISGGTLIRLSDPTSPSDFYYPFAVLPVPPAEYHWIPFFTFRGPAYHLELPLWLPLAITLAATVWCIRRHQRATNPAHAATCPPCPSCGYDRTGLPEGVRCPECNSLPTPSPASVQQDKTTTPSRGATFMARARSSARQ